MHFILRNQVKSLVSRYLLQNVVPVSGCIVRCDLINGIADHTGIYVGNNQIVELDRNGYARIVSPKTFLSGTRLRNGMNIYIACDKQNNVLYKRKIAARARDIVGNKREYNFLMDNCHQLTAGCITGDFENPNNFMLFLDHEISKHLNNGNSIKWRVWNIL